MLFYPAALPLSRQTLASAAIAQDVELVTSDRARANFGRPITLAPDDGCAFSAPPAGFADQRAGVAAGRIKKLSYASDLQRTRSDTNLIALRSFSGKRKKRWQREIASFSCA